MTTADCYICAQEAEFADLPPRERIAHDPHWRVVHSFTTALPGWLVLLPRRHVVAVHDLTDDEAAALGAWQVRLSRALHRTTGCAKTYVAQFAESKGFAHVHFHIVPRMADLAEHLRGPGVFALLNDPDRVVVDPARADALALRIQAELAGEPVGEPAGEPASAS